MKLIKNVAMKYFILLLLYFSCYNCIIAQNNIVVTSSEADAILKGNYNPEDYNATQIITDHQTIVSGINKNISPDLLKEYIIKLTEFETRNTGSDTLSDIRGIGATRRWVHQFFKNISMENNSRLIPFYLQFDQNICGMNQHRNICAVLPGTNADDHSVIIIEAHIDSRCDTGCDIDCVAQGAEDNASGSALVMELVRVMSAYSYNSSIVFMCTIGEEQGLLGANAFAEYCRVNDINVKAVFNNDIVGGIYCGETSSPPSCPEEGHIDSTQVRLFSQSGPSRQLSRFNRYEYEEELLPIVDVPMLLTIMKQEDRTGRGGDHIPFRQKGYSAMRFTSANENGSANSGDPQYDDHQHTSNDILGVDTDGDSVLDSFFVDFNYLARNAVINGMSATMAAIGPLTPLFDAEESGDKLIVTIDDPEDYLEYRIFSRSTEEYFDTVYSLSGSKTIEIDRINNPNTLQKVSVAAVDSDGIESLFSRESVYFPFITSTKEVLIDGIASSQIVQLDQNHPNPFGEQSTISILIHKHELIKQLELGIYDLAGRKIKALLLDKNLDNQTISINASDYHSGIYYYGLILNGQNIQSRKMVILP